MNILDIAKLVDKYDILNNLNKEENRDYAKMKAEYVLKLFTKHDIQINSDNTLSLKKDLPIDAKEVTNDNVYYCELVMLTSQMNGDVQFEIMTKLNKLTPLLILKYFCNHHAFYRTCEYHLHQNSIDIQQNN